MNRKELWSKIRRQFVPNVGTIVLVLMLLWAQQAGALGFLSPTSSGTSTTTISYQGRLADAAGIPLNDTVGMTFRIYNAATGGSPLWTEIYPAVQISDGLFHVLLGSTTPLPNSLFNDNDTLYLGITVGADDEMTPREQLASAPWAMSVPDGAITSSKLAPTVMVNEDEEDITTTDASNYAKLQQVSVDIDSTSKLLVLWQSHVTNNTSNCGGDFQIYLDGSPLNGQNSVLRTHYLAAGVQPISIGGVIEGVTPGTHTIEVWWKARIGGTLKNHSRHLSVIVIGQ